MGATVPSWRRGGAGGSVTRTPTWGPKKLRAWLAAAEPGTDWSAESTIGEVLRRAGLTQPRAQPKRTAPPAAAEVPNALWTIDYKGQFRTGDGVWLYPLTVQDAHSRYLLGCAGHRQVSGPATRATLQKVFREHGLPERLRSDNGSPFASVGTGRLSKLAAWWLKLGIGLERIQPGKPQQNGRHERMHRVLKAETARQQERFDRFRDEYNLVRPHEALAQRTPASAHARSAREYPERVPDPEYPLHYPASPVLRASPPPYRPKLASSQLACARHRQSLPCSFFPERTITSPTRWAEAKPR